MNSQQTQNQKIKERIQNTVYINPRDPKSIKDAVQTLTAKRASQAKQGQNT